METYTTDDALTAMGFGKFQGFVLLYAGMGWVVDAMELMLLSFLGPAIRMKWNVSPQQESLLSSVVFAGMLIGALTWGFVSDKYGRRMALLFSTLFTTVMGFLSALSPNYSCLLALRFFVGVGVSASHVFLSWFLEFVPAQNRGKWMVVFSCFWTVGAIMEASLAWVVLSNLTWRWLLALTAVPSALLLVFFVLTPESPRYLCAQSRISDATLVLEKMASANKAALPQGVVTYHRETNSDHQSNVNCEAGNVSGRVEDCTDNDAVSKSGSGGIPALRRLFSPKLLRTTLILWFNFFANSFGYYGLVLLTSQLSDANKNCHSGKASSAAQHKDGNLYRDTFITSLAEIPGLILSAVLVDWLGRKASMWSMLFACCGFLVPLVLHQNELLTTILLFGARACAMGSFTVLCLYAPEVYPTHARSTGVGIATAIGRIGGVVCPIVAVGMLRSCHQMAAVIVFELVLFLAGVTCFLFPYETKGREIE